MSSPATGTSPAPSPALPRHPMMRCRSTRERVAARISRRTSPSSCMPPPTRTFATRQRRLKNIFKCKQARGRWGSRHSTFTWRTGPPCATNASPRTSSCDRRGPRGWRGARACSSRTCEGGVNDSRISLCYLQPHRAILGSLVHKKTRRRLPSVQVRPPQLCSLECAATYHPRSTTLPSCSLAWPSAGGGRFRPSGPTR